jgi:hypothetical protein
MRNSLIFDSLLTSYPPFRIDNAQMIFRLNASIFSTQGTNNEIQVTTTGTWTISRSDTWIHTDINGATGNGVTFVSVDVLASGTRTGSINFLIGAAVLATCIIIQGNY